MPGPLTLTPEQQRIQDLFKNNNPTANFALPNDPTLQQDVRAGDPAEDYKPTTTLLTEQATPNTDYMAAIRNRFNGINQLGQGATQAVFAAKQQQQIAAQQSYGSGQVLGQQTQYQPGVGGARGAVLAAVAAQQGTPYSWGGGNSSGKTKGIGRGANTVGFDCSGLVQYAYAQIGMKMPRLAEQQATMGAKVPINKLRPGDLVAGPGHIAVYAGNGMMWEAPRTGLTVRLTSVRNGMTGVHLNY
jgi:cell wall-associated NlpC family hydrolase